ncbi:hypothetical protein [Halocynthiibacter sp.]|uniref:hypothetical protein n=1 Tax=Halocynthiibacter sp. TaxID=1979210 RepID=UPI003C35FBF1
MSTILDLLHYPRLNCLAETDLSKTFPDLTGPAEWYGHPPALIPVLSDGSLPAYLGVWYNWFKPEQSSFVGMSVSNNYMLSELARNEHQAVIYLCARSIVGADGVTAEILHLATKLGISADELAQIDEITIETGDDPEGLLELSAFKSSSPKECNPEGYNGYFPYQESENLMQNTIFEFDFPPSQENAPWLDNQSNKIDLFERALEAGDLTQAWLLLNASGWPFRLAAKALRKLSAAKNDLTFRLFCSAWIEQAEHYDGGY